MDDKQFKLFERAIQRSLDDVLIDRGLLTPVGFIPKRGVSWHQAHWFLGEMTSKTTKDAVGAKWGVLEITCNSSACVAGNIAVMAGAKLVADIDDGDAGEAVSTNYCMTKDKAVREIPDFAEEAIGAPVGSLFNGDNSICDVIGYAQAIAAKAGHELCLVGLEHLNADELEDVKVASQAFYA